MDQDFRKKTFRGAKIEDVILELEKLTELCEDKRKACDTVDQQRFYEGMSIAYTTVSLKLKGEFDYIEPKVIDELYNAAVSQTGSGHTGSDSTAYTAVCSFCRKDKQEVGELAIGPGVSICRECLSFSEAVLQAGPPAK
ncbi:ClpX C4-type zinc finger protein [Paenibacillus tarimensis]|uniref:ClpX C4-type zinc finger protein n=1 Tax=Paenibacillus tarimensis TaxID=416012 RepID=UPI001F1A1213|nr:ClpX C4-type zinc finger protein [Paenibacillus tarimensis]MCF2943306.1 hypothetical protein [Paenibacillus tarimensis]